MVRVPGSKVERGRGESNEAGERQGPEGDDGARKLKDLDFLASCRTIAK